MDSKTKDLKQYPVWHPFTQMKIGGIPPRVKRAKGNWLELEDGTQLLDAVASWWVNPFGHGRPELADAIRNQVLELDHTIFAGFSHEPAEQLSNRIIEMLGAPFSKVFFSDNGSTSVEVALKMAIQSFVQQDPKTPIQVLGLKDGYHGDTFGSMSAGRGNGFFDPFASFLFDTICLPNPGDDGFLDELKGAVAKPGNKVLILESLILGAGGMKMYSPAILDAVFEICKKSDTLVIADEVMTGFGRTGKMFGFQWAKHTPDFVCLSKCLTGGIMPMGITVTHDGIFDLFLSDAKSDAFLHGHSYTGNPVGCAAALATMELYRNTDMDEVWDRFRTTYAAWSEVLATSVAVERCHYQGIVFALHLKVEGGGYFAAGVSEISGWAAEKGVLLRPLGNVVYVLPPFTFGNEELAQVWDAIWYVLKKWEERAD